MRVAILGGGYTGLIIAKELIEKGNKVTIFEKNSVIGGMVDTIELFDTRIEKYYRHIFKSDVEVIKLVKELNLNDKLVWPETKMGYFSNGKMYDFGTPISLLKFKELNIIEKFLFSINIITINLIKKHENIEKVTAENWIKKRAGSKVYTKIWEPLLISKFESEKSNISMAWLWGKIKLRKSSSNYKGEKLGYIEGSYQVLTDALYKYLINKGVEIQLKSEVFKVKKQHEKYIINYKKDKNINTSESFDIIVSTLAFPITSSLIGNYLNDEEKLKINQVKYTAARTMIIISNKSLIPYYWLNIGDPDIIFGGIIEHTNYISSEKYNGKHVIYISNYMLKNNPMMKISKSMLLEKYIKCFNVINKNFTKDDIILYDVFDEQYAQPVITCNYSKSIMNKKINAEKIYIASMPQIYPEDRGLNHAIILGKEVAKEIMINQRKNLF